MAFPLSTSFALVLATVAAAPASAQRRVIQITTASEVHMNAKISPNGNLVAFQGPGKIAVVSYLGSAETPIASGSNLGSFLWSPRSTGVYYLDGSDLRFVAAGGGSPVTLTTLPGQQLRLWCVDAQDRTLFGTRYDQAASLYRIFSIGTNGANRTDIVFSVQGLDDVRLDPSDTKILFRNHDFSTPFSPREYFSADRSGANQVSLTGGPINGNPDYGDWVDAGQSIAFTLTSPVSFFPHLARIGPASTAIAMLTEGTSLRRFSAVFPDRKWIAHQAAWAGGIGPAILPPDGGGLVVLSAEDPTTYAFGSPPSVDASGTRVVFAASVNGQLAQIYRVELDRELRIFPRVQIGQGVTVELPIAANEVGAAFISAGLLPQPFRLLGFTYGLALDPTVLVTALSGSSASGKLAVAFPVPNDVSMVDQTLYFQGIRVRTPTTGDFTRFAEVRIF